MNTIIITTIMKGLQCNQGGEYDLNDDHDDDNDVDKVVADKEANETIKNYDILGKKHGVKFLNGGL